LAESSDLAGEGDLSESVSPAFWFAEEAPASGSAFVRDFFTDSDVCDFAPSCGDFAAAVLESFEVLRGLFIDPERGDFAASESFEVLRGLFIDPDRGAFLSLGGGERLFDGSFRGEGPGGGSIRVRRGSSFDEEVGDDRGGGVEAESETGIVPLCGETLDSFCAEYPPSLREEETVSRRGEGEGDFEEEAIVCRRGEGLSDVARREVVLGEGSRWRGVWSLLLGLPGTFSSFEEDDITDTVDIRNTPGPFRFSVVPLPEGRRCMAKKLTDTDRKTNGPKYVPAVMFSTRDSASVEEEAVSVKEVSPFCSVTTAPCGE
jgi:hypothetical protein